MTVALSLSLSSPLTSLSPSRPLSLSHAILYILCPSYVHLNEPRIYSNTPYVYAPHPDMLDKQPYIQHRCQQCVAAVWCSVLQQCGAVCCSSVVQCIAAVLQHVAALCFINVQQRVALNRGVSSGMQCGAACCSSVLQFVAAVCCNNVLQRVALN